MLTSLSKLTVRPYCQPCVCKVFNILAPLSLIVFRQWALLLSYQFNMCPLSSLSSKIRLPQLKHMAAQLLNSSGCLQMTRHENGADILAYFSYCMLIKEYSNVTGVFLFLIPNFKFFFIWLKSISNAKIFFLSNCMCACVRVETCDECVSPTVLGENTRWSETVTVNGAGDQASQHRPTPSLDKGPHTRPEGATIHLFKCKDWVVFKMLAACTEQQCNCRLFYFYHAKFPPQSLFDVGPLTLFALTDTFGPKRHTISSLTTIFIKDVDQWELGKKIMLGHRQQVRFLRVRRQRQVRDRLGRYRVIRQERNTRELCTSQRTIR